MTMQTSAVKVENISFVAIKGTSATEEAIRFACSDSFPCENLYLQDVQIVSYFGGYTSAFCWKALGSFSGLIYPPPCFMFPKSYIGRKALPGSVLQSIWRHLCLSQWLKFNSIEHFCHGSFAGRGGYLHFQVQAFMHFGLSSFWPGMNDVRNSEWKKFGPSIVVYNL